MSVNFVHLCHCLSTWLNCLLDLMRGIIVFTMNWLVTCMFPIAIPLCPISLRSTSLTLGQRRSCLFSSSITCLIIATLEGFWLLFGT